MVIPAALDTPQFRAAWSEWLAYRTERHLSPYKPKGLRAQFNKLAKFGAGAACDAIAESIAQNWQGLFPGRSPNKFQPAAVPELPSGESLKTLLNF